MNTEDKLKAIKKILAKSAKRRKESLEEAARKIH